MNEIISQAIEKGGVKSKILIMGATHTRTQYSVKTPIEILRDVSKKIRKQLYHDVPEVKNLGPSKLHSTASLEDEVIYTQQLVQFATDYVNQNPKIKSTIDPVLTVLENDAYPNILFVSDQDAKLGY